AGLLLPLRTLHAAAVQAHGRLRVRLRACEVRLRQRVTAHALPRVWVAKGCPGIRTILRSRARRVSVPVPVAVSVSVSVSVSVAIAVASGQAFAIVEDVLVAPARVVALLARLLRHASVVALTIRVAGWDRAIRAVRVELGAQRFAGRAGAMIGVGLVEFAGRDDHPDGESGGDGEGNPLFGHGDGHGSCVLATADDADSGARGSNRRDAEGLSRGLLALLGALADVGAEHDDARHGRGGADSEQGVADRAVIGAGQLVSIGGRIIDSAARDLDRAPNCCAEPEHGDANPRVAERADRLHGLRDRRLVA